MTGSAVNLVLALLLPFWGISLVYYLCLLPDASRRRENRLLWLALILLFGPFSIAGYKVKREPGMPGTSTGDTAYNLARHLMLPWSLYLFVYPILFFIFELFAQGRAYWAEYVYWLVLVILVAVLPLWLVTMALLLTIQVVRSRRRKSQIKMKNL